MQVVVLIKANADSEAGVIPPEEVFEAMGAFNDELVAAGVMLAADGLAPSDRAKRVAFDGDTRRVIDGPFTEVRELVAGFWVWEVADMDEAVAWAMRIPNPLHSDGVVELRPVYAREDFPDYDGTFGEGGRALEARTRETYEGR